MQTQEVKKQREANTSDINMSILLLVSPLVSSTFLAFQVTDIKKK